EAAEPTVLFNGVNLLGWEFRGTAKEKPGVWTVKNGSLVCLGGGGAWIAPSKIYRDFDLSLEYKLDDGANSGVYLRAPAAGRISSVGMEIQIIDEHSPRYSDPNHKQFYQLKPYQRTGSLYGVQPPTKTATKPAGEWNTMAVRCQGRKLTVAVNGETVVDADLDAYPDHEKAHPGIKRADGYLGVSSHNGRVEFRNIVVTEL
ncbi:MAG: 3-keto-disaccharide hydrolase, partial [Planctomycetia bacterium]